MFDSFACANGGVNENDDVDDGGSDDENYDSMMNLFCCS